MGDLIKFRPKPSHLNRDGRPPLSEDYADLIIRIKTCLERINRIMADCRKEIKERDDSRQ